MWLNPLKGDHLTLRQLDKTLPVDTDTATNKKVERGIFVYISTVQTATSDPAQAARFALYTSTQAAKANAVPYIALQWWNDTQANMAGNTVQAPATIGAESDYSAATGDNLTFINKTGNTEQPTYIGEQPFSGPRVTAVSVLAPAEWQTNAFENTTTKPGTSLTDADYYVGCPLSINDDGMLCPWTAGHNIVGYVSVAPSIRWINDLGASKEGARISGGNSKVLAFSTAWIPVAVAQPQTPPTPAPMSVSKPAVTAAAAPAAQNAPAAQPPKAQNTPAK